MTPTTIGGRIAGVIAGVFLLVVVIAVVFFITVRIWCAKSQHARATTQQLVTHTGDGTTTVASTGSIPISTQPHPPPPTTALPQPQPQSAPELTFTQPSPSITEAPPPAYHLHETFVIYSENKKPSDDPPPTIIRLTMQQLKRLSVNLPTLLKTNT